MHVDLRTAAKDDAVGVDQIDRTFGLDLAEDLARHSAGIDHPVERDPVVGAVAGVAGALVEIEQRIGADIEARPGQNGLLAFLHHCDVGLSVARRLRRQIGVLPQRRIAADIGRKPFIWDNRISNDSKTRSDHLFLDPSDEAWELS